MITPICERGQQGSEKLTNLLTVTQLFINGARIQTELFGLKNLESTTASYSTVRNFVLG